MVVEAAVSNNKKKWGKPYEQRFSHVEDAMQKAANQKPPVREDKPRVVPFIQTIHR